MKNNGAMPIPQQDNIRNKLLLRNAMEKNIRL